MCWLAACGLGAGCSLFSLSITFALAFGFCVFGFFCFGVVFSIFGLFS